MTDDEMLKTIKASVHASSAMSIFLNHAFCVLAQQLNVDRKSLIDQIQSLSVPDGDETFQKTYSSSRDLLVKNLEE